MTDTPTHAGITAVIPHWYDERFPTLERGIVALQTGTVRPEQILIWDNTNCLAPTWDRWADVHVIRSSTNIGACGRFLAALLAKTPWVWFQDNDVVVQPETLERARAYAELAQGYHDPAIFSLEGRIQPNADRPYRRWNKIHGHGLTDRGIPVTISLGRAELTAVEVVRALVPTLPWGGDLSMDDIWWSYAAERHSPPIPRVVIPTVAGQSSITEAKTAGTGFCHTPGFYETRDQLVRTLFPRRSDDVA